MTIKQYKLTDTAEETWDVLPGDPAHPLCDLLHKLQWEPRLPMTVLASGVVTPEDIQSAEEDLAGVLDEVEDTVIDEILDLHRTVRQLLYLYGTMAPSQTIGEANG